MQGGYSLRHCTQPSLHRPEKRTSTPPTGSSSNAIVSSSGSITKRRHHRAGDNNFSPTQSFAESRQHIRDVPHDIYPIAGVGLRIAGAHELSTAPEDSAYDVVRCAAGARRCVAREHNVPLINIAA